MKDLKQTKEVLDYYESILCQYDKLSEKHDSDVSKILILNLLRGINDEISEINKSMMDFMLQWENLKVLNEIQRRINNEFHEMVGNRTEHIGEWFDNGGEKK